MPFKELQNTFPNLIQSTRRNKMMTRKDYIAVAEILNTFKNEIEETIFEDITFNFAEMFAIDNPNFDVTRFENAVMK